MLLLTSVSKNPFGQGRKHKPSKILSELPETKWGGKGYGATTRTRGSACHPGHAAGASTRRTAGWPATSSRVTLDLRPARARLAQPPSRPRPQRSAAPALSPTLFHTKASPPEGTAPTSLPPPPPPPPSPPPRPHPTLST